LEDFVLSVQVQTHGDWHLWIRDDASSDASREIALALAARDARIQVLPTDGARIGAAASFGWLLDHLPADAEAIMFADQDDVWLPEKIEHTLVAMEVVERRRPGPVLIHTDLIVVDAVLREIDPSFWHYAMIDPEPVSLRRLIVQNVATGATVMVNRALRERAGRLPPDAAMHDWWFACVAAAFGRMLAMRPPTVLYRQHGANSIGARRPVDALAWRDVAGAVPHAFRRAPQVRAHIGAAARQARAFLDRYHDDLPETDRRFLAAYARIPERGFFRRKLDVFNLQLQPEHGLLRNAGILLRA
jgi:hypothetical protein